MYTIEQLQSKTLGALKEIGEELNVLPPDDRRRRQSWINAIVGVNPPLLQLLEVSPEPEIEQFQPIAEAAKNSPGVEAEPVQDAPLESKFGRIVYPQPAQGAMATPKFQIGDLVQSKTMTWGLEKKSMTGTVLELLPRGGVRVQFGNHISGYGGTFDFSKSQLEDLIPVQEAIEPIDALVNTSQRQDAIEPIDALVNTSQRQDAIEPVAKTSPGVEVDRVSEPIEQAAKTSPGVEVDRVSEAIETTETQSKFDCPTCKAVGSLHIARDCCLETWFIRCLHCDYRRLMNPSSAYLCVPDPAKDLFGIFPFKDDLLRRLELQATEANEFPPPAQARFQVGDLVKSVAQRWGISPDLTGEVVMVHPSGGLFVHFGSGGHQTYSRFQSKDLIKLEPIEEVQAQEPIEPEPKNSHGVEVDQVQHPIIEMVETFPATEVKQAQEAIAPAAKNLPSRRSKTSTAHQLLEFFKSSARIIEDSPGVKTEATVSESAIVPATKNSLDAEGNQNPTLTGIFLSDRFVARYSPPQAENVRFQIDTDGQLSLLDFEVLSQPEPPDPDDFESLDGFREAIARWDGEHPNSFDHCSDLLPSSLCTEPSSQDNDVSSQDNDVSSQDNDVSSQYKPLEISLASFCEWAQCPEDWYELHTLLEPSKVSELSPTRKISIISDFFIPTFGRWGDHNRGDEPPDTGIYAKLPKPKPPTFPSAARTQRERNASTTSQPETIPKLSRNYPETIPKLFRVVADSSTQLARSPPGGDA